MQQSLFFSKEAVYGDDWGLTITSHPEIGLMQFTRPTVFGPQVYPTLSANIARGSDTVTSDGGTDDDACQALVNIEDIAGNFLLVPKSTVPDCDYVTQSANALAAGAVGMVGGLTS